MATYVVELTEAEMVLLEKGLEQHTFSLIDVQYAAGITDAQRQWADNERFNVAVLMRRLKSLTAGAPTQPDSSTTTTQGE